MAAPLQRLAPYAGFAALLTAAPAGAAGDPGQPGNGRLSNERTFTRWAHPERRATIRRRPSVKARPAARIHFLTEDGFPEVYLVLRRRVNRYGKSWLSVRIPMRPNGRTGWVREESLGPLNLVRTRLVVDRGALRATLRRAGTRAWQSPIGVGAAGTSTPAGRFWIRERIRVPFGGGTYGPWAFGTSAYSALSDWPAGGVVGIHGTNQPSLIPGRPSHGCIRVPNPAIRRLARLMPVGTPVQIR